MLKHGEVNPLNVFGLRQLNYCPPHFEVISFDLYVSPKVITDWIYENLEGRFYLGDHYQPDDADPTKIKMLKAAGFERHEEASYFGLFLPSINKLFF